MMSRSKLLRSEATSLLPVEVQHGGERPRVSVEEELVLAQIVVVAQLHQRLVTGALLEIAQPRVREAL